MAGGSGNDVTASAAHNCEPVGNSRGGDDVVVECRVILMEVVQSWRF